jgi:tetratricopeptide (TPR) repeat protein
MEELAMADNLAGVQAYQQRKNSAALAFFENAAYYDKKVDLYKRNYRLAQAAVSNDEGIVFFSQGNWQKARDKFSAAHVLNGDDPVYSQNVQYASAMMQNQFGLNQGAAGHYDEAISAFNSAGRNDPAHRDFYRRNALFFTAIVTNNRGIELWNRGDFHGALQSFEQAAVENPADKRYRDNAELARQKMGNGGTASGGAAIADAAQKAYRANADGVAAEKRGDNLASLRFFEQAVAYGGPDVHVNRNNVKLMKAKALNDHGIAAYNKGDYLLEVRYYKQAISYGGPNISIFRSNLAGAETRLAAATAKTSEVIQTVATARGADPTQWSISPKIPSSFSAESLNPPMAPDEKRRWLNNKLYTQLHYLQALNYQLYSNMIVCFANCTGEEDVWEVMDLASEIADTRRQLRLLSPANAATAEKTYIRDVKTVHVPPPPAGGYVAVGSVGTTSGHPPAQIPNSPVQIRTLQNCNPIWESFPGVVVEPKLIGYDRGTPRYVWQYVARTNIRATYPVNCYK